MTRPKITIMKKHIVDDRGHYRFYSPNYNRSMPKYKPKVVTISLDLTPQFSKDGREFPIVPFRTEKQLVVFLYNNWGPGEYLIFGHLKGREGAWTFWRGAVEHDGWIFMNKNYKDSDVAQVERDLIKAQTEEEKAELQEDLEFFKEMTREEKKGVRYGFIPFLKSSGKRGVWHAWEEYDDGFEKIAKEEEQKKDPNKFRINKDSMNLDEINII